MNSNQTACADGRFVKQSEIFQVYAMVVFLVVFNITVCGCGRDRTDPPSLGFFSDERIERIECPSCQGRGRSAWTCSACNGWGSCAKCRNTGLEECHLCKGSGKVYEVGLGGCCYATYEEAEEAKSVARAQVQTFVGANTKKESEGDSGNMIKPNKWWIAISVGLVWLVSRSSLCRSFIAGMKEGIAQSRESRENNGR